MAIETRPPESRIVIPANPVHPALPSRHWGLRGTLIGLAAFMAISAILGAIFVVPTLPQSLLRQGVLSIFTDYTIPALALGVICGGVALVALVALILRPRLGALDAILAGVVMIVFELVEIAAIGFTAAQEPTQPEYWLQVLYLLVGGALVILGARLWMMENRLTPWKAAR